MRHRHRRKKAAHGKAHLSRRRLSKPPCHDIRLGNRYSTLAPDETSNHVHMQPPPLPPPLPGPPPLLTRLTVLRQQAGPALTASSRPPHLPGESLERYRTRVGLGQRSKLSEAQGQQQSLHRLGVPTSPQQAVMPAIPEASRSLSCVSPQLQCTALPHTRQQPAWTVSPSPTTTRLSIASPPPAATLTMPQTSPTMPPIALPPNSTPRSLTTPPPCSPQHINLPTTAATPLNTRTPEPPDINQSPATRPPPLTPRIAPAPAPAPVHPQVNIPPPTTPLQLGPTASPVLTPASTQPAAPTPTPTAYPHTTSPPTTLPMPTPPNLPPMTHADVNATAPTDDNPSPARLYTNSSYDVSQSPDPTAPCEHTPDLRLQPAVAEPIPTPQLIYSCDPTLHDPRPPPTPAHILSISACKSTSRVDTVEDLDTPQEAGSTAMVQPVVPANLRVPPHIPTLPASSTAVTTRVLRARTTSQDRLDTRPARSRPPTDVLRTATTHRKPTTRSHSVPPLPARASAASRKTIEPRKGGWVS